MSRNRPQRTNATRVSYEEPPEMVLDSHDSEDDFMVHEQRRSRRKRSRDQPLRTRSGRSSIRPPQYAENFSKRRRSTRTRTANVTYDDNDNDDSLSDLIHDDESDARPRRRRRSRDRERIRRRTYMESPSDDDAISEELLDEGCADYDEDADPEDEPSPKRRSPRNRSAKAVADTNNSNANTAEQKDSIMCKLPIKNVKQEEEEDRVEPANLEEQVEGGTQNADNANADAFKPSDDSDAEKPVRRSTRAHGKKSLNEESKEGEEEDEKDDDFKPESGEGEDEDDDFEKEKVHEESSLDDKPIHERTRSRARGRHGTEAQKEPRSSARLATRQERRSSGARKHYPDRSRRAPKRFRSDTTALRRRSRPARDTYRPRRESMRPQDFYDSETSSSSSSSDDELNASAPPGIAPSSKEAKAADFLHNNPMALAEEMGQRRPRSSRYARRRSRNAKAGLDPRQDIHGKGRPSKHPPIEPIKVDLNLKWDDIGGLDHHVRALKEMVFLPLVYPEVFEKFKIEPPKGVLFYGPPGTGKTLCARTLAASCGGTGDPEEPADQNANENVGTRVAEAAHKLHVQMGELSQVPEQQSILLPEPQPADASNGIASPEEPKSQKSADLPNGTFEQRTADSIEPDGYIVAPKASDKTPTANGTHTAMEIEVNGVTEGPEVEKIKSIPAVQHATDMLTAAAASEPLKEAQGAPSAPPVKEGQGEQSTEAKKRTERRPRVAFFMRNGADCLSKWVGEAERQLRMTFEAAKRHQPSIIFFDEIDGLAPVRSSRQDQIHSSIVSTLLGLMDGLDRRGQIVVIGATNRVDAIDPALRRPGRFDRELIFTLPNGKARRRILEIQTNDWKPVPPSPVVLDAIAERSVGYCGADLRALCTEAALRAVRRRYPQIYASNDKLLIDIDNVRVGTRDFLAAMRDIVPASHRSARTHARPIPPMLMPVLKKAFDECVEIVHRVFPHGVSPEFKKSLAENANGDATNASSKIVDDVLSEDISDDENDQVRELPGNAGREVYGQSRSSMLERPIHRPRLLVCGRPGLGQSHLGPALLHFLEGCPVHAIDLPSLHMNSSARSPEEALVSAVREACRAAPSVLYLPHLQIWWKTAPEAQRSTLTISLRDIPADLPVLLLATAEEDSATLAPELVQLFTESVTLAPFGPDQRNAMFEPLLAQIAECPKASNAALRRKRVQRMQPLPKAPPPPPKPVTNEETERQSYEDDRFIRTLRMQMRDFVENLLRDRKFKVFWDPVDPSVASDYYEIIKEPMDISKIAAQVDKGMYPTVFAMVRDFDLMVKNAIQYNPAHTEEGAAILRRAHGLVDIVHAWVDNLNPLLVETCNKIVVKRMQKVAADKIVAAQGGQQKPDDCEEKADGTRQPQGEQPVPMEVEEPAAALEAPEKPPLPNGAVQEKSAAPAQAAPVPEEAEPEGASEPEPFVAACPKEVGVLKHLVGSITHGVAVDGLERLHAKLAGVLYSRRRARDRARVLADVRQALMAARDDPAVVGNLVE